ncbi:MAG: glycosyltransferase family 2 protein [Ilumatobacteraceae bacterium]
MHHSDPAARPQPVALLSVVMAVYNEAATVAEVIEDVLTLDLNDRRLELIIVESNSTDGTRDIVTSFEHVQGVRVLYQDMPQGKGFAVRAGIDAALGDVILIQDGDLEYSVTDYPALLKPIERGETSFVLGSRHVRGQPMRHFADSRLTSFVLNAAHWGFTALFDLTYGVRLHDPFTMYKVFRRECIEGLEFTSNRFDFDWELVAKLVRSGHRPIEVPVTYTSRDFKSGKKVRMLRDPLTWLVACAKFRVAPVVRRPPPASDEATPAPRT